ncbi:pyrophosphate-dependent phosphofructokinase [Congregibacter litoralis KT71]|uniref:Pyrophosphate--fructose 6-phosphate 1-phosphotransferase n=1 Tax=Congregibacter litoralis KT71 TaxID=314285 RepID=A4AA10_9GAMM|nr:6-phosphofructokinase [Congregibacter litoralis]EAQ97327.2 pyrophosphate-dependent phosphofructokinase [Congregibacter litoralis KT71]
MSSKANAFYAQSGGVTSVINASACGVIETAREHRDVIAKVYAGRNGIIGALQEELIDTSKESKAAIRGLLQTPSGAFGSCRHKLKSLEKNRAEYERLIDVFRAHNIRYFFYNGGGDSADTCLKVSQLGESLGYPLQAIHVPKTIDNDLPHTDNSPGFGSVAKYVAISTREAALDVASMCASSTKVFILEVMGRHAGWIAAASGLAAEQEGDAPHVILFPEVAFDKKKFLARVEKSVKRFGYCVVVASEGAQTADGRFLSDMGTRDAFGHAQLGGLAPALAAMVKKELGYKYHWAVADYLQRAARHIASQTDLDQAYAVGEAAVKMAVAGKTAVMPAIVRGKGKRYSWRIGEAPLDEVANVEKKMPRNFISRDGFAITPAARDYLQPLIQGEAYPSYRQGLPRYVRMKNELVPRKLRKRFKVA